MRLGLQFVNHCSVFGYKFNLKNSKSAANQYVAVTSTRFKLITIMEMVVVIALLVISL